MTTRTLTLGFLLVAACAEPETKPGPVPPASESDADHDGSSVSEDCDDADPARFPGADEVCDGIDNDCDLEVDDDPIDGLAGYTDDDGDGYGAEPAVIVACERSPTLLDRGEDCNDGDPAVHAGGVERCDGIDGDCDPSTGEDGLISVGEQTFATLQEAVDAASDGDTVQICNGVYGGPVLLPPIGLVLQSQNGAADTVVEGAGDGPVFVATGGAPTFRGLTISGGAPGGSAFGGGLSATHAVVTVEDSVFTGNRHPAGGAIGVEFGALNVARSTFTGNGAVGDTGDGGAIRTVNATVVVTDSTFTDNSATVSAGALSAASGASIDIAGCTFTDNTAGIEAGAGRLLTEAVTISQSTFTGNVATLGSGGALSMWRAATVSDCTFEDNLAVVGGAIFQFTDTLVVERTDFIGNRAGSSGGALSVYDYATVTVIDSTLHENVAGTAGGGLDMQQSDGTLFTSIGSDWGIGMTNNLPADIYAGFEEWSFSTEDFSCRGWPNPDCQ